MYSSWYTTGDDGGDLGSCLEGFFDPSTGLSYTRWAIRVPQNDQLQPADLATYRISTNYLRDDATVNFGSAHRSTWNAVFCDGSVHSLSYNMSLATHKALATRDGGDSPDPKEY